MTLFTYFPKKVKVLHIQDTPFGFQLYHKWVSGTKWVIGKYYVAEHSKTIGLDIGDEFIIEHHFDKSGH